MNYGPKTFLFGWLVGSSFFLMTDVYVMEMQTLPANIIGFPYLNCYWTFSINWESFYSIAWLVK